jgi:hypothetical protein
MARARNIKPGFFINDELAEIEPLGRLLFAGLWCLADREGRLEDRPKRIKAEVLPYDDCDVDKLLNDLQDRGFIVRYEVDGNQYIQVINFKKHQNPHVKEADSIIPPPPTDEPVPEKHSASTVQAPKQHSENPADSLNLIPDSLNLIPEDILSSSETNDTPSSDDKPKIPYQEVAELYNDICASMPKVEKITEKRRKAIKATWTNNPDINTFKRLFEKAEASDFLSGRSGKWTSCNFDWLMNANNMLKVLEGTYDNRAAPPEPPEPPSKGDNIVFDYEAAKKSKYGW